MSVPFAVRALDHIVLRARDQDALVQFYLDVVGCSVEKRQDAIGLVQLRAGSSLIDIVSIDGKLGRLGGAAPGVDGRNLDHFCLRIEPFDVEVLRAHLRSHGVTPGEYGSRYGAEGEGPSLYFSDIDGNTVELKGPPGEA